MCMEMVTTRDGYGVRHKISTKPWQTLYEICIIK